MESEEYMREKVWLIARWAAFLWLVFAGIGLVCLSPDNDGWIARAGQFGDLFGALNAGFASIAAVGAIYAVVMQRRAMDLQKEDMAEQAEIQRIHLHLLQDETRERQRLADIAITPFLIVRWEGYVANSGTFSIHNAGAAVFDLSIHGATCSHGEVERMEMDQDIILEKDRPVKVTYELRNTVDEEGVISFALAFKNGRNEPGGISFNVPTDPRFREGPMVSF